MMNKNQDKNLSKKKIWPNRFCIGALVERFCHDGYIYKYAWMDLFQIKMSEEEAKSLLTPLGFIHDMTNKKYLGLINQAEDSFSEIQALELTDYYQGSPRIKVFKSEACLPKLGCVGFHGISLPPSMGLFDFYDIPGYPLSFDVSAVYLVDPKHLIGLHPDLERRMEVERKIQENIRKMDSIKQLEEAAELTSRMVN